MEPEEDKPGGRKPRADSLRNRARLLAAAREVFSEGGAGASLEAVAQRAGVGIGTLYRHFPTREALFQAVYRNEVDQLVALAARLKTEAPPVEALRLWLRAAIDMAATKKGMIAALVPAPTPDLYADSGARTMAAAEALMARAASAGAIRDDLSSRDLMMTLFGMCHLQGQPGWRENVARLVDVFVDGLSSPAATG